MRARRKIRLLTGICVLLLAGSLSACSPKETDNKKQTASEESAQPTATPTAVPTTAPEEEQKEVLVNKTFLSKSKRKNIYQKNKKKTSHAKSAASLKSWKNKGVKEQIVKFVKEATNPDSKGYIPQEDRIVVTDIDGTLIAEGGTKVDNDDMAVKTAGEAKDYLLKIQNQYFDKEKKLKYCGILYQPMQEMLDYLKANGFDIYFVSGNCNSLTYAWANYFFEADYAHSIGSNAVLETDETQGYKMGPTGKYEGCWKEVKSYRIYNQIGKCPVLAFGNSDGDVQMLKWVTVNPDYSGLSVMINHDDEREYVYSTDSISGFCKEGGFLDAKISENFKTIFVK